LSRAQIGKHGRDHRPDGLDPLTGGYIAFDVHNSGDWLAVTTNSTGGFGGAGIQFQALGAFTSMFFKTDDLGTGELGEFDFQANGAQADFTFRGDRDFNVDVSEDINLNATRTDPWGRTGRDVNISANRDVNIGSVGGGEVNVGAFHTLPAGVFITLPNTDPGVSGALWNNSGIVSVSP
jgi:hypothetical protein